MKQKIKNISLKTHIWVCIVPMVILFMLMTFILIPGLQQLSGNMQLLDTMFKGYDGAYVHQLFEKLQNNGKRAYLSLELYADVPFIFLYMITFTISIAKLLVRNGLWNSVIYYSLFFPICAGVFDLGENIGIITMLSLKKNIPESVVKLASYNTILKGYFLPLTLITLFSQLVIIGYRRLISRSKNM
ncbi:hypothetical protein [Chitinophaga sp.]|uniref:hypothetical protein n=1 Tax=Chitinophaga sp. TaxID=1869181 RepID=UPI0031DF424F